MNLSDINELKKLLDTSGFSFKKSLGQNFIIDGSVCPKMAELSCDENTGVIEIGPGVGVLTRELAKRAKRVVAIEIDERLKPILSKTLEDFNNIEVVFGDVMKLDLKKMIAEKFTDCKKVCVCANLPYYITSPIIMMLLESKLNIDSITAMVQAEAAERLCAKVGSRQAGAVTVAVDYYSSANILFDVKRECFLPSPKVDSAVIKLEIRQNPPINVNDEKTFFKVVKACFAQRRKTLLNTVSNTLSIDKDVLRKILEEIDLEPTVRGEQLNITQLALLSDKIYTSTFKPQPA
ncbi:MAG: 16S rRNA (adenine(1518)-N(6)/adenine(1519)-N(6))-dimethyltransferase RsmA [Clostridia bacterium]|nr:16S rRNA (adenine(1518)-N(6)/adenine(1519)-N(6))-dimethyltransferase RsmA [Clostridia bacterium]